MADKLKVGVIGAGMISEDHLGGYTKDPRVEVVWVADVIEERARSQAKKYGAGKHLTDYKKGFGEVQAVSICTPPFAHLQPALDAIKAEKHVLVEKPMTMVAKEAKQMADAAEKAGVQLGLCSARASLNPAIETAREMVASGKLGEVYYARVTSLRQRGRPGLDFWPDVTWFLNSKKSGGGAVNDIGCYDIDILMYVLGRPEPVSVNATWATEIGSQRVPKGVVHDTEEHLTAMVRFKGGSSAVFETAWAANMEGNDFVVYGKMGGIRLNPFTFFHEDAKGHFTKEKLDPKGKSESLQADFVSACLGKKKTREPNTPGRAGFHVMQVIEGALKSAREGREVKVSELK
jgi:predicted dehydrogenase